MREKLKKGFSRNWRLYVLMMPALLWLIVFAYMPMYGILIAFKDYKGKMGILGSPWHSLYSNILFPFLEPALHPR